MPRSPRPLRDGSLAAALGVTRVARLTSLDRTGVEVASAIRPAAHVLQVTNGKGATFADAAAGALLEAAELWAAERPVPDAWDSAAGLAERAGADAVLPPDVLAPESSPPDAASLRLAWRAGRDLVGGRAAWVPAHAVHCPPAAAPLLGPSVVPWTSNGMGAHPDPVAATLHALLELVERDQLARALPDGFTDAAIAARLVDRRALAKAAPRAWALVEAIEAQGIRAYVLDVGGCADAMARMEPVNAPGERGCGPSVRGEEPPPLDLHLPCFAAVLVDEGGPVPVAAGYACRLTTDDAVLAAVLEAAQSRATEIHGAREDVALGDRTVATLLAPRLERARPRDRALARRDARARSAAAGVRAVLSRLVRAGIARVVAIDVGGPPGVHVVKVLAPGLLLSELL